MVEGSDSRSPDSSSQRQLGSIDPNTQPTYPKSYWEEKLIGKGLVPEHNPSEESLSVSYLWHNGLWGFEGMTVVCVASRVSSSLTSRRNTC